MTSQRAAAPPASVLLIALRSATAASHQRLEDGIDIVRCVADLERYRRLLEGFLGFYRPLEARLFDAHDWAPSGLDPGERRKSPWLESDLRALGGTANGLDRVPLCPDLPVTASLAQAFGCLYVLEGATLGGRQITALMQNSPIPQDARRFFASYGPRTGERWREFLGAMEAYAGQESEIVGGAVETFARMEQWIGDSGR